MKGSGAVKIDPKDIQIAIDRSKRFLGPAYWKAFCPHCSARLVEGKCPTKWCKERGR